MRDGTNPPIPRVGPPYSFVLPFRFGLEQKKEARPRIVHGALLFLVADVHLRESGLKKRVNRMSMWTYDPAIP